MVLVNLNERNSFSETLKKNNILHQQKTILSRPVVPGMT